MKLLVAVRILTYNHEGFIRKCLESVVVQKASFRFKAIIGEDYSTDKTAFICKEFEKLYPDLIELHCSAFNNLQVNSSKNWEKCITSDAKYIAILEGDDNWTDPYKLQKQVDFLEKNLEYSFCCTNISVIDEFGVEQLNAWPNKSSSFSINKRSLGLNLPVPTCSLVFRADSVLRVKGVLKELSKCELADHFLKSWLLTQGKGHFFEEKMAVYRQHGGGFYTQMTQRKRLKSLKKARTQFLLFCIKKGRLFSALICIKNMLYYPNF